MPTITIEHADGSTETIAETTAWTRTREIGGMRRARIDVERSLAQDVTLEEKSDIVQLGTSPWRFQRANIRYIGVEAIDARPAPEPLAVGIPPAARKSPQRQTERYGL